MQIPARRTALGNHVTIRIFFKPLDLPRRARQEIQRAILMQQFAKSHYNLCPGRDIHCNL
jgi:hypothetical protein